jgi:hypothetical protein
VRFYTLIIIIGDDLIIFHFIAVFYVRVDTFPSVENAKRFVFVFDRHQKIDPDSEKRTLAAIITRPLVGRHSHGVTHWKSAVDVCGGQNLCIV